MSPRHTRILKFVAATAILTISWQLLRPTGDPRIVGSWRHAEPAWNETYRFDANGRGVTLYEGEPERQFRWHVEGDRVVVRYFLKEQRSLFPTVVLDLWDRVVDDASMTNAEVWEPLESDAQPKELVRLIPRPIQSNPMKSVAYRRMAVRRF